MKKQQNKKGLGSIKVVVTIPLERVISAAELSEGEFSREDVLHAAVMLELAARCARVVPQYVLADYIGLGLGFDREYLQSLAEALLSGRNLFEEAA